MTPEWVKTVLRQIHNQRFIQAVILKSQSASGFKVTLQVVTTLFLSSKYYVLYAFFSRILGIQLKKKLCKNRVYAVRRVYEFNTHII